MSWKDKLWGNWQKALKVPIKVELSDIIVRALGFRLGKPFQQNFGREINRLIEKEGSLPLAGDSLLGDRDTALIQSEYQRLEKEITQHFGQFLTEANTTLQQIKSEIQKERPLEFFNHGRAIPISPLYLRSSLLQELKEAEKEQARLLRYVELSAKALNDYTESFKESFTPTLTLSEADELAELTWQYYSREAACFSCENMALIRKKLGFPQHEKLNEEILHREKKQMVLEWREIQDSRPPDLAAAQALLTKISRFEEKIVKLKLEGKQDGFPDCHHIKAVVMAKFPELAADDFSRKKPDLQGITLLPKAPVR